MSNANRDYAIIYDVKNSSLILSRPLVFYITDRNTSNIFVRLVTKVNIGDGVDQYTDIEEASSYALTMKVIKPNNEVNSIEATQHEEASIFQFDLTEDFKDIPGKYICELTISTIVSERQELITSDPFNYEVKRSILSNISEIIETEDTTVEKLLNNLEASKIRLFNDLELAKTNLHNDLNATSSTLNSQIQASNNKIENIKTELSSQINATKAELSSQIKTITKNKIYVKNFNSIQEAINSINVTDGIVELHFENKTYNESSITFKSNIKYVGNGATIISNNSNPSTALINCNNLNNFIVEDLILDGNSIINTVMRVANCSDYKFKNITVKQGLNYGVEDYKNTNGLYDECVLTNNKSSHFNHAGIMINSNNMVFTKCKFNNNEGNGLRLDNYYDKTNGCKFIKFEYCEANNNKQHGFLSNPSYLDNKPNNIIFNSCFANYNGVDHLYSGFAIHYIDHLIMTGCVANGNKEHGIVLMDGLYTTITGCVSKDNGYSGVRLQGDFVRSEDSFTGVHNAIISNNIIESNGLYSLNSSANLALCNGISIGGNCSYISITNNHILNNKGYIVRIDVHENYTNCQNIFINDNFINGNKRTTTPVIGDNLFAFPGDVYNDNIWGTNLIKNIKSSIRNDFKKVDCSAMGSTLVLGDNTTNYSILSNNALTVNSIKIDNVKFGDEITLFFNQTPDNAITLCNGSAGMGLKVGKLVLTCDNSDVVKFIYDGSFWRLTSYHAL